jgi:hypothetical protein
MGCSPEIHYAQGRCATGLRYAPTFSTPLILKYFLKSRNDHWGPTVPKPCQNSDAHVERVKTPRVYFQWFRLSAWVTRRPGGGNADCSIQLRNLAANLLIP